MERSKDIFLEIQQMRQQAENGEINELDVYIQLQDIEAFVKESKEKIKPLAINQCLKFSEKTFEHSGRKITYSERATWSYKHSKLWLQIEQHKKELENKMKSAYTMKLDTDSETGEIITPALPTYSQVISISKNN